MIAAHDQFTPESIAETIGAILRPRERMRPSDWAEKHRTIPKGKSPRPGPFRCDFLPWIRPILDVIVDEPWLQGWVLMKPAQVAGSEIGVTLTGYLADQEPNPMGFIATKQQQARKFAIERFEPMIQNSPRLGGIFLRGREAHETLDYKPFLGGALYLVGSGSPNDLISNPMAYVFLDELDRLKDFPTMGSALDIAQRRTAEFSTLGRTGIFAWAHPTSRDRGAARFYHEQSDRREWTLDCPHCKEPIVPKWEQVRIDGRDPTTARHHCPECDQRITDAQRWSASTRGRFVSQIESEAERRRKKYAGFHVSQLCHPRRTLEEVAAEWCKCTSESQLQVFWNMTLGLPYTHATFLLTDEMIAEKIGSHRLPGSALGGQAISCPPDTRFVTAGVDVQKGKTDPLLYVQVNAWSASGNDHVLWYGKLNGFRPLATLLEQFEAATPQGQAFQIHACGIDWGYKARDYVFPFCRQRYGSCTPIPMKHASHVPPSDPVKYDDTIDPDRPELGKLRRLYLCRDHWMDRQLRRLTADPTVGGSVVLPIGMDAEFRAHLRAAYMTEEEDKDGYPRIRWKKPDGERDDYLQAGVYSEVAAYLCGLDRMEPTRQPVGRGVAAKKRMDEVRKNIERYGRPWVPDAKESWV